MDGAWTFINCAMSLYIVTDLYQVNFGCSVDQNGLLPNVKNLIDTKQMLILLPVFCLPRSSKLELIVLVEMSLSCYDINKQPIL